MNEDAGDVIGEATNPLRGMAEAPPGRRTTSTRRWTQMQIPWAIEEIQFLKMDWDQLRSTFAAQLLQRMGRRRPQKVGFVVGSWHIHWVRLGGRMLIYWCFERSLCSREPLRNKTWRGNASTSSKHSHFKKRGQYHVVDSEVWNYRKNIPTELTYPLWEKEIHFQSDLGWGKLLFFIPTNAL